MGKKIIAVLCCIIIFAGFLNLLMKFNTEEPTIINFIEYAKTELTFSDKINECLEDIYDTIQLSLNKKEIGNFTYYKNTETNGLMVIRGSLNTKKILINSNKINALSDYLKKQNISYIFVDIPKEVKDREKLKNIDYSNEESDLLLENLDESVHVIDLKNYNQIVALPENFYKTDHHMNMETVFETYKVIINEIQAKYRIQISSKYLDLENYRQEIIPKSFWGSKGVNVGDKYIEKEDFILYLPKYDTDFKYRQFNTEGIEIVRKNGSFEKALINNKLLKDSTYVNKYTCFLYGNVGKSENIIINNNAENNKKVLIISNSFGRAIVPYISQCFYETRCIDPQKGRFEGDVLTYIDEYAPDIVIMIYDATSDMSNIKIN